MPLKPISSVEVKEKKIILRADLNSNVQGGKIIASARLREHSKTIKSLAERGASIIVLTHQGRKGKPDFVSLKQHAVVLAELTGKKVQFIEKEQKLLELVPRLKDSQIVLFENTRFFEWETQELLPEEHAKNPFIFELAKLCDFFVLDGFSIAHRSHGSVVGFTSLLPSYMGPVFESELSALHKATGFKERPRCLVLGGAKPLDSVKVIDFFLSNSKAEQVLVSGLLGDYFFKAVKFPESDSFFEEKDLSGFPEKARSLFSSFREQIFLPKDFAIEAEGKRKEISGEELEMEMHSLDIGQETIESFASKINESKLIVFNGPPGMFEKSGFSVGSTGLFKAIVNSSAFSFMGGGDTETALTRLGFKAEQFSHVSLSGKASLKFLAGALLPGIESLKKSKK